MTGCGNLSREKKGTTMIIIMLQVHCTVVVCKGKSGGMDTLVCENNNYYLQGMYQT